MVIYFIRAYVLYKKGSTVVHFVFMALYPIGNMALYGSIYITLAVSIERFLGKCHFSPIFPKSKVLYMSSSFGLLGVESRAFSQAEKERTACTAEQIHKMTAIFTQNDNLGPF